MTVEEATGVLRGRDAIDPNLWVVVAAHTDLQTSFPALLVAAVMMESDVPLWVSAAMAALESGQGAPVLNAIVDAALFQTDNAFYDALSYWSSLPVNESETPDEEAAAEGTDDGDQAVPDGAPALKIDVRDVRSHAQILLDLAGERMELVPTLGQEMLARLVNSGDPSASLLHGEE